MNSEIKLIMLGNVNRGGKDNSVTHTMSKDLHLQLQLEHMDIV